jgi:hypothetical protein
MHRRTQFLALFSAITVLSLSIFMAPGLATTKKAPLLKVDGGGSPPPPPNCAAEPDKSDQTSKICDLDGDGVDNFKDDCDTPPTPAGTPVDSKGCGEEEGDGPKTTICHFPPGNPANAHAITINTSALPAHIGPHAGDFVIDNAQPCPPNTGSPPPIDACTNLVEFQAVVPPGYHLASAGICLIDLPPDVCDNLAGDQAEIPEGYHDGGDKQCIANSPPPCEETLRVAADTELPDPCDPPCEVPVNRVAADVEIPDPCDSSPPPLDCNPGEHEDNGECVQDKVTICHATHSANHPYNEIEVSANSADSEGHAAHEGDLIPAPETGCPRTAPGSIKVVKQVAGESDTTADFDFDFGEDTDWTTLSDDDFETESNLAASENGYEITEENVDGWDVPQIECTSDLEEDEAIDVSAFRMLLDQPLVGADYTVDGHKVTVRLRNGENVVCTFTNTESEPTTGTITIDKTTDPSDSTQKFDFSVDQTETNVGGADDLTGPGDPSDPIEVDTGTYQVTETAVDGWTLASASCVDNDAPIIVGDTRLRALGVFDAEGIGSLDGNTLYSVEVPAGHDLLCTFHNEKDEAPTGTITIHKSVTYGTDYDAETWDFTIDGDTDYTVPDVGVGVEASIETEVEAGTYAVGETQMDGWVLESAYCYKGETLYDNRDGDTVYSVVVGEDDDLDCYFRNNRTNGTISIKKTTDVPTEDTFDFTITEHYAEGQDGTTGDSVSDVGKDETSDPVSVEGNELYDVTELTTDGWTLDGASCIDLDYQQQSRTTAEIQIGNGTGHQDGNTVEEVYVPRGHDILCTFDNNKDAVTTGTINIHKWTNVVTEDTFDFNIGDGEFSKDVDNVPGGDSSGPVEVPTGHYDVTESAAAGWSLSSPYCYDSTVVSGRGLAVDLPPPGVASDVVVETGHSVECWFYNYTIYGTISIHKTTDVETNHTFDFTIDELGEGQFAGAVADLSSGETSAPVQVVGGNSYEVAESPTEGWALANAVCVDLDSQREKALAQQEIPGPTPLDPSNLFVPAGHDILCNFNNNHTEDQPEVPPTDLCNNIAGVQTSVPEGMTADGEGACNPPPPPPPTDVCPNIEGDQETVPEGLMVDANGDCVTPPDNTASITVTNDIEEKSDQNETFLFTFQKDSPTLFRAVAQLSAGSTELGSGESDTVSNLVPGDYTVTQSAKGGWDPPTIDCGDAVVSSGNSFVQVHLRSGEHAFCVFKNKQKDEVLGEVIHHGDGPAGRPHVRAGVLPFTGAGVLPVGYLGLVLVLTGAALIRRRRFV